MGIALCLRYTEVAQLGTEDTADRLIRGKLVGLLDGGAQSANLESWSFCRLLGFFLHDGWVLKVSVPRDPGRSCIVLYDLGKSYSMPVIITSLLISN